VQKKIYLNPETNAVVFCSFLTYKIPLSCARRQVKRKFKNLYNFQNHFKLWNLKSEW